MFYFLVCLTIHKYILTLREYWPNKWIKHGGKRSEGPVANMVITTTWVISPNSTEMTLKKWRKYKSIQQGKVTSSVKEMSSKFGRHDYFIKGEGQNNLAGGGIKGSKWIHPDEFEKPSGIEGTFLCKQVELKTGMYRRSIRCPDSLKSVQLWLHHLLWQKIKIKQNRFNKQGFGLGNTRNIWRYVWEAVWNIGQLMPICILRGVLPCLLSHMACRTLAAKKGIEGLFSGDPLPHEKRPAGRHYAGIDICCTHKYSWLYYSKAYQLPNPTQTY